MTPPEIDVGSKIRAFRKRNGLSLNQLSQLTGIAASNLSAIERNKSSPTLRTLVRIASAFHMRAGAFLDEVMHPNATLWRKGEGMRVDTGSDAHSVHILADEPHRGVTAPRIITLDPDSQSLRADGEDRDRFVHCLEGHVSVSAAGEDYELSAGDSLYLRPYSRASLLNRGSVVASLLMVVTCDTARG
ncbi:MAG: helix-turn-helix domain-containing protein [Deltaproteobacteria bacterium]